MTDMHPLHQQLIDHLYDIGALGSNLSNPPRSQFERWLEQRIADAIAADRKRRGDTPPSGFNATKLAEVAVEPVTSSGLQWHWRGKWYISPNEPNRLRAAEVARVAAIIDAERDAAIAEQDVEIERLTAEVAHWRMARASALAAGELMQADIERLRGALEAIAEGCSFPTDEVQRAVRDRARAALSAGAKGGE